LGAVNRTSWGVLLGFVAVAVAVVALPRSEHRVVAPPANGSKAPTALPALSGSADALELPPIPSETPPAGDPDDVGGGEISDAGTVLPDGGPVPELTNAPKQLHFDVVLVTYAGAQGAPRAARSKVEAEKLAAELAELAKSDFSAAVKKGDSGSTEDAGKMYRGILEPAPDYVLFGLEPGQVGGPVDTPRGFWIVRRAK
jgi:hypothetical protein